MEPDYLEDNNREEQELAFAAMLSELLYTTDGDAEVVRVDTYAEEGMLTNNAGLVVSLADGSQYQLTVVQSRESLEARA
jgi:hypothetical protein